MLFCPKKPRTAPPPSRAPTPMRFFFLGDDQWTDALYLCKTFVFKECLGIHKQTTVHLSNPKPGHITGGSRRGARRGGGVGSGRTVRQQNCSPRGQSSPALSKASKSCRLNCFPEEQTNEILCKPKEERNDRLNRGSSAVYQRDEKRSLFLAADQWNNAFLSL